MKKLLSLATAMLCLTLVATGCGKTASPEEVVTNGLTAVKNIDTENMSTYFDSEDLFGADFELNREDESTKLLVDKLAFKVVSSKIDGDTATVTTEITNIDMSYVMGEFLSQAITAVFENAGSEEEISEEDFDAKTEQILLDIMGDVDVQTTTLTADISLVKVDGKWKISVDETFQNALFGGLIDAQKGLEGN